MPSKKPLSMSNREVENRAIAFVLAYERAAGRHARDTRHIASSQVDVESTDDMDEKRLIEVKAFGGTGRGDDLWLEPNQVGVLSRNANAHLYLVTNIRSTDPSAVRILDLSGAQLWKLLERKREKHYFEVPLPVAVYDELQSSAIEPSTSTGTSFVIDGGEIDNAHE